MKMKLHNGWASVNNIILFLHLVIPVWLLAWMYTSAISTPLLLTAVVMSLLLGVVHKIVVKLGKGKPVLHVFRVLAVGSILAVYAPLVMLAGFQNAKVMYPFKRWVYTVGVFGENHAYYDALLPETLPQHCENYSYRAQGSMVAQDYHPTSWLEFTTDTGALDGYAAYYASQGYARCTDAGNYRWVMRMFRQSVAEDADIPADVVFYYINEYYPKAVVLDYAEGRFYVLT